MKNTISAKALIRGSEKYPQITGYAVFLPADVGTTVSISVYGLPKAMPCSEGIFAVHIHDGSSCTGNASDSFADTKSHYDTSGCPHPYHSGDMPSLFSAESEAHLAFVTDRFTPRDIIGKTIVIHGNADDMHSQPSGSSGEKIACGEIRPLFT